MIMNADSEHPLTKIQWGSQGSGSYGFIDDREIISFYTSNYVLRVRLTQYGLDIIGDGGLEMRPIAPNRCLILIGPLDR